MAVDAQALPKSQPDVGKINGFTGCIVTVTKHTGPRNTVGEGIVTSVSMSAKQALELQTQLPLQHGPGFYRFTVTDAGGSGDDVWLVRLGPEATEGSPMAIPGAAPAHNPSAAAMAGVPLAEGVTQIAPGWFYNEGMALLHTPWREVVQWRQGDPLPKPPSAPAAAASPFPQLGFPGVPPSTPWGWGGYPAANDTKGDELQAMQRRLDDERRQREMDALRAEMKRSEDAAQRRAEDAQRQAAAQAEQFRTLVEKLTAKPAGPSEEMQALQRRLDEAERRREESERETRHREEQRQADDRHRAELQAMNDKLDRTLRETAGNKTDPVLTLLTTMMAASQATQTETMRTIQASGAATAAASEAHSRQVVELVTRARDDGAGASKLVVENMAGLLTAQREVFTQLLEVSGGGNQPAWVPVATAALDRVGVLGQALMERNQIMQQQQQEQARRQPQVEVVAAGPRRAPPAARVQGAPAQAQRALTPEEIRAQAANNVGHFAPRADAPMNGAPTAPALHVVPRAAPAQEAAPGNDVVDTAAPVPTNKRKRSNKRETAAPVTAPPKDPKRGYSVAEIAEMPEEAVRDAAARYADDVFFGPLWQQVPQLRLGVATLTPEQFTAYVMQGREYLLQKGEVPPALDLLEAGQFVVVIERLIPAAPPEYQAEVVAGLRAISSGDDGEDDDEEDAAG